MKNGFTLIELLLAVSLFASLAMLSAIFYSRFLLQSNVANVQDQLFGALRKANTYSLVSRNSSTSGWGVHYDGTNKKVILFQGATYAGRNISLDEPFSLNGSISISGFSDITFSRLTGMPNPAGTTTITILGNNGISKQITVNEQGVPTR